MRLIKVWATFTVPGFHKWPSAPANVSYLRSLHRHNFHFKVTVQVGHGQRALEFHTLKDAAQQMLSNLFSPAVVVESTALNFGSNSCEQIADKLLKKLSDYYPESHSLSVDVSEDGEFGGSVALIK